MRDLDELLDEAKTGTLTDEEINYVGKRLEASLSSADPELYSIIYILGRADMLDIPSNIYSVPRGLKYRPIIEKYLFYPDDPDVTIIALKTLCSYWDLTEDYVQEISQFIKKVDWDVDGQIAIIAMSIAGEYLKYTLNKDKKLLQLLLDVWESQYTQKEPKYDEIELESTYRAIARAVGEEWNSILESSEPQPKVLEKAQAVCR